MISCFRPSFSSFITGPPPPMTLFFSFPPFLFSFRLSYSFLLFFCFRLSFLYMPFLYLLIFTVFTLSSRILFYFLFLSHTFSAFFRDSFFPPFLSSHSPNPERRICLIILLFCVSLFRYFYIVVLFLRFSILILLFHVFFSFSCFLPLHYTACS